MVDMIYIIVAFVTIVVSYGALIYIKNKRFWELVGKINGFKPSPIFGNALQFENNSVDILRYMSNMWKECGFGTYRLILGYDVFIMLNEPDHVEVLLSSNKELTKMDDYLFLYKWLGDGLLISTGKKWRKQRKVITPTFHYKILEQFTEIFNDKGEIFIQKLGENKGKVFDVYPYVTLCALDVISESAMGVSINAQENAQSAYVQAVYAFCELTHIKTFSVWKRNSFFYWFSKDRKKEIAYLKTLHTTTTDVINQRKELLHDEIQTKMNDESTDLNADEEFFGRNKKTAFLDLLLLSKTSEGLPLSDETIQDEVNTFMFEGHDTTSSAISFTIYLLANHPDVQMKAFQEQVSIFGDNASKRVEFRDLQEMKYLELVIKESLRLYPSVPFFGRKISDDLILKDGIIIPKGCSVGVQPYFMHRNPRFFTEPEKFNPDRFSPENVRSKHPYLFIPFSAGPRNCIGQKFAMFEIKTLLSEVLRNFELYSAGPEHEPILAAEIILKSKNGINIQLRDRVYS